MRILSAFPAFLPLILVAQLGCSPGDSSTDQPDAGDAQIGGQDGGTTDAGAPGDAGCVPTSCTAQGKDCGTIPDGCGRTLECGECSGFDSCGGGGAENVCGCTSTTCSVQGKNCGSIPDECGGTRNCGTCSFPETCGGAGPANVCGFSNPNFTIDTVDDVGDVGEHVSLALSGSGQAFLSYEKADTDDLKYAYYDVDHWSTQVVDNGVLAGSFTSIALDGTGAPRIAEMSFEGLVYWTGPAWSKTVVDSLGGEHVDLAFDGSGNPHICHMRTSTGYLKYSHYEPGNGWSTQTIDGSADPASYVGQYCSIAVDSLGGVHISYEDHNFFRLMYATKAAGATTWTVEPVDETDGAGTYTSLELDSGGAPVISYHNWLTSQVLLTRKVGGVWTKEVVDTVASIAAYTSLGLDSAGNPHISYYDANSGGLLKLAKKTSSVWDIQVVDIIGTGSGGYNELQLDGSGQAHIAFYNSVGGFLGYAREN